MDVMTHDRLNEGQSALLEDVVGAVRSGAEEVMMGGAAGTGKTTMLSLVAQAASEIAANREVGDGEDAREGEARIAAPTNRAAKILRSKLPPGSNATTLHYLLGAAPKEYSVKDIPGVEALLEEEGLDPERRVIASKLLDDLRSIETLEGVWQERWDAGDTAGAAIATEKVRQIEEGMINFSLRGGKIGEGDIVICDEASMVHEDLRQSALRTGAQLVWVGDPFQLEPVKGTCWFEPPRQRVLTQVMRQEGESGILRVATAVREGQGDTRKLAKFIQSDDVEFIFPREGEPINWEYLVSAYGDKWLTWRNGFNTRNHDFHTKTLNDRYRTACHYRSSTPEYGERLYVTEGYADPCKRVSLSKGDEVVVECSADDSIRPMSAHHCKAKTKGFTQIEPPLGRSPEGIAAEARKEGMRCVCEWYDRHLSIKPEFCNGARGRAYTFDAMREPNPWREGLAESEALMLGVSYHPPNGRTQDIPNIPIDPELLYWDKEQSDRLYRLDKRHAEPGEGSRRPGASPRSLSLRVQYAYAGSVHQAQGGEWDSVCVFWDGWRGRPGARDQANALKWLYTAVTRAARRLCIVTI